MFWISLSCLWSSQPQFMALFTVFNLLIGPVFIFEPCGRFSFANSHFTITTLGLDLFSDAYLHKLLFSAVC